MNTITETDVPTSAALPPRLKIRMLQQMAEALEDEAAAIYRRVAAFEEEEFLLNREIEERQTEINRIMLKLESLRSERDSLAQKGESLRAEASAMREEVFNSEEELALATIGGAPVEDELVSESLVGGSYDCPPGGLPRGAHYFRRMRPTDQAA